MDNQPSSVNTLPFWFVTLTLVYTLVSWFSLTSDSIFLMHVGGVIGLFVPVGIYSLIALVTQFAQLTLILGLLVAVIFGGEFLLRRFSVTGYIKTLIIFCILIALTMITDFILWGSPFQSFEYLVSGGVVSM